MKKWVKILLFFLIGTFVYSILHFAIPFTIASTRYGYKDPIEKDGITYEINTFKKECFASYVCLPDNESFVIDIPDEVDGYKVTALGGYVGLGAPCPFSSDIWEKCDIEYTIDNYSDFEFPEGSEFLEYRLTVNLGSNVEEVYCILGPDTYHKLKGSQTYVKVLVYFNCPEDNKYFYSVDGVLYNKTDDTPVIEYFS